MESLLRDTIFNGLKRKSTRKCSLWAENYRKIKGTPWSFRRAPWTREVHDINCDEWYAQKSAQMGFTETVMNVCFFSIDQLGQDVLYVLPTESPDATDFSVTRCNPAIEESEHLSSMFNQKNNVGLKQAGNCSLYIRGSRSRNSLKSVPVSKVILDEVDEFDQAAISLARERLGGNIHTTIAGISTPSIPDWGINKLFEDTTQDHFFFKCPHCSRFTELTYPECLVIQCDDHTYYSIESSLTSEQALSEFDIKDPSIRKSHLICKECHHPLDHESKQDWLYEGFWKSNFSNRNAKGFYINQLYSITQEPYKIAIHAIKAEDDVVEQKEFYNSKLGLPIIPKGSVITDENIQEAYSNYKNRSFLDRSSFLTIGVDVGTWLHCIVLKWQFDPSISDMNDAGFPQVAYIEKFSNFNEIIGLIKEIRPRGGVIDAQPERRSALTVARMFPGIIFTCFYNESRTREISSTNKNPLDPIDTITADRTSWLDQSLGRFRSGKIKIPMDTPKEFKDHLMNLVRSPERNQYGETIFRYKRRGDDHYAQALNYAELGLAVCSGIGAPKNIDWS